LAGLFTISRVLFIAFGILELRSIQKCHLFSEFTSFSASDSLLIVTPQSVVIQTAALAQSLAMYSSQDFPSPLQGLVGFVDHTLGEVRVVN